MAKFLENFINYYANKSKILNLDFSKSRFSIYSKQKGLILTLAAYTAIDDISLSLLPIFIGWVIETQSYTNLTIVICGYLFIEIMGWFSYHPMLVRLLTQTSDSFRYGAYKFFLSVDPVEHAKKPLGLITGKIQRTAVAFLDFTDTVIDEIFPIIVENLTVIIMIGFINVKLGMITGIFILATSTLFTMASIYMTTNDEQQNINQDDIVNQIGSESIYQHQTIRSSFATIWAKNILLLENQKAMYLQNFAWLKHRLIRGIFITIYFIILAILIGYLIILTANDTISKVFATTLILTFLRGTRGILSIDKKIKVLLSSNSKIKDFYAFVKTFEKQSFPVFETQGKHVDINRDKISLKAEALSFNYNNKSIFNNISFALNVKNNSSHQNMLYGIIGPSGIGKTTLISILGGQVKPQTGKVLINDIDIYTINDNEKRKLIAMQNQTSTGFKGDLRFNLTFGLPEFINFSDQYLINLLKDIGLWQIFEDKGGLNAQISESGTNLSGGQRQRLSFANLYLRANYFKPLVIFIDEPTSSLDELSEKNITEMILDLSLNSLTLVIAHRLKTLQDANEILDLSIPAQDGVIQFHGKSDLMQKSEYYKKLLAGIESL